MIGIINKTRHYPRIYEPYYEQFDFYNGRDAWLESIKDMPIKAVHLFTLHFLHVEVYNGGFWQYFYNSTSTSYPEAIQGYEAIGMHEVASIINSAASKLGNPFPFEKEEREKSVGPPENRMDFSSEDIRFYELADTKQFFRRVPKFVPFAEEYAKST